MRKVSKVEAYIKKQKLEGKKVADVLRDYDQGHCALGEICGFHGYDLFKAVWHVNAIFGGLLA